MTVDVQTYRAATMQAALDIVRRELGPDAVILHTRQAEEPRRWPWSARQSVVEITASREVAVRALRTAAASTTAAGSNTHRLDDGDLAPPPPLLGPKSKGLAEAPRAHTVTPPRWSPNDVIDDRPAAKAVVTATTEQKSTTGTPGQPGAKSADAKTQAKSERPKTLPPAQAQTVAARMRLESTAAPIIPSEPAQVEPHQRRAATTPADMVGIHQRLETLQKMILDLGRERRGSSVHDVPPELFQLYTSLIENEVEDELARELVCRAKQLATRGSVNDRHGAATLLAGVIEQELRIASPITPAKGRRKVIALVGPTGVGKTTTLAKLAANFRLREGARIGLVTVDTYRIAAVEQLRTYAEIIDLPMRVVTTPVEMRQAMSELADLDLVLIDTAGRSPKDDVQIQELKAFLEEARVDEVHLVVSLGASPQALEATAANFRAVTPTAVIFTKLDEVTGTGALLNAARRLRTPISYLTTGQDVPDDIEPAQKTRMAKLILGQEALHTPRQQLQRINSVLRNEH